MTLVLSKSQYSLEVGIFWENYLVSKVSELKIDKVRCSHGVVGNVLNCGLEVSEFEPQLSYYTHFRINTIEKKSMTPPLFLRYELISTTSVLLRG